MSIVIKFTQTALTAKKKSGVLTPDEDGYYNLIVGGLNVYNSAGEYYVSKGALDLFESSSHLMRRIKSGSLYLEVGHPIKTPNMSFKDYYNRIVTIDENNVCAHISEISLDFNYGKEHPEFNNPDMIAIMAKVKPTGLKKDALAHSIGDPKQNVSFSLRGLTDNVYVNGRTERTLTQIVTWDFVNEGGINIANKWNAPGLEMIAISDYTVDRDLLLSMAKENLDSTICTENSRSILTEIVSLFETVKPHRGKVFEW